MAFSGPDLGKLDGINEINITPFVDVVLVLLVIFIVTAPMMMKDVIGLHLPKASTTQTQSLSTLAIAVTKNGQFLLNGDLVSPEGLQDRAAHARAGHADVQAVISADGDARHSDVIHAIDIIKSAGVDNFAIQVERSR